MNAAPLTLEWLPGRYAVCRLDAGAAVPAWAVAPDAGGQARLWSITRTERETAIVIDESRVPTDLDPSMPMQRGFIAMRIVGTLDFALTGVLARLTAALAEAGVSVFVLSTYDTDIVLVREGDRARAAHALQAIAVFT